MESCIILMKLQKHANSIYRCFIAALIRFYEASSFKPIKGFKRNRESCGFLYANLNYKLFVYLHSLLFLYVLIFIGLKLETDTLPTQTVEKLLRWLYVC